ncbi:MAG TPA: DUF4105 domain-containing protein [Cyclobacteriaceae bacterium]|nr:DUF4105 domain-containing protein [Cyclobacteriaceae bacterium]
MRKLFILLSFFIAHGVYSQSFPLTDSARVSIITCGPSQSEVYTAFGHSAIRVTDPVQNIDIVYNYGVFDFDRPNFYLNFTRGNLLYMLAAWNYADFKYQYIYYNRSIHEQELDLTFDQKQKVFDFLQWNAQPENRDYLYDYFYDNCATRVRDVFANVLKGEIQFDDSYIKTEYSVRDLTHSYLEYQPWGELGIEICLGLPMDKKITPYQYMFIPDYVESGFEHAFLNGRPIVLKKEITYQARPEVYSKDWFHPWIIFGGILVLAIGLTILDWKRKKLSKWFDVILFAVTGLIGFLLLLLWVFTDHKAAANNFNLLWAMPTHFIAALFLFRKKIPMWLGRYFMVITILGNLTLLSWLFLPQQLNLFLVPLTIAMVIRSIWIYLYSFEALVTNE